VLVCSFVQVEGKPNGGLPGVGVVGVGLSYNPPRVPSRGADSGHRRQMAPLLTSVQREEERVARVEHSLRGARKRG